MKSLILLLVLVLAAPAAEITITFTLPDAKAESIIADLAAAKGYQGAVLKDKANSAETVPNPESRLDFLKRTIGAELIQALAQYRAAAAAAAASDAAKAATLEGAKGVGIK